MGRELPRATAQVMATRIWVSRLPYIAMGDEALPFTWDLDREGSLVFFPCRQGSQRYPELILPRVTLGVTKDPASQSLWVSY